MLLFLLKLYRTVRRVIAARRHPHQLAWAIALGLWLGLVPHGNLAAVCLLCFILCFRINHAAMGLTALGFTFIATRFDPWTNAVGEWLYAQPKIHDAAMTAWQWPLMPWTDLQNTVVIGSFSVGLAAVLPTFFVTYPPLKWISRLGKSDPQLDIASAAVASEVSEPFANAAIQAPVIPVTESTRDADRTAAEDVSAETAPGEKPFVRMDPSHNEPTPTHPVRTRIDVLRMHKNDPQQWDESSDSLKFEPLPSPQPNPEAMDEALNYLLRQLRNTRPGDAA